MAGEAPVPAPAGCGRRRAVHRRIDHHRIEAMTNSVHPSVKWLAVLALAALPGSAWATLELPLLFGDGAVLQRDVPMRVWGWATPGTRVQVRLDGQAASAVASADGRWQ